jgi:hypothetical protein
VKPISKRRPWDGPLVKPSTKADSIKISSLVRRNSQRKLLDELVVKVQSVSSLAKPISKRRPWDGPLVKSVVKTQPAKVNSLNKPISKRRPWDGPLVKPDVNSQSVSSLAQSIFKRGPLSKILARGSNSFPKNPLLKNSLFGAPNNLHLNQQRLIEKQKLLNQKMISLFRK